MVVRNLSKFSESTLSSGGSRHRRSASRLFILETREFPGLYSYPKPQQIPRGAAQSSLNFLTKLSWIETRGGYHALGGKLAGAGKVLGLYTAHKWDGTEIPFRADKSGALKYYDVVSDTWIEVGGNGANILSGAATFKNPDGSVGENVYMSEYFSPAGAQLWVSSPNSDLIKILVANPASYLSLYSSSKNFKGRIRISQNAMWLWHYNTSTLTGGKATGATQQRSYIDSQNYTAKTGESQTVTNANPNVTFTLASQSGVLTSFGITVHYTDGVYTETFTDNYLGALTGSNGGTGTVNYTTGAVSLTPNQAPANPAATADYQLEDSTNHGIADFTHSGTRLAGEGVSWLQNDGGDILGNFPYNGSYYILHQRKAWVVTPTSDDSGATNIIYRENISIASERGGVATADGIFYVDTTISTRPYIALLTYNPIASQVLPVDLSSNILDLSPYVFDKCAAYEWGDFIVFECRTSDSTENNRMVVYNKKLSSSKQRIFDLLDLWASNFSVYAGQLLGGDSISNNVYKLFDGFDDDGGLPKYSWSGNIDDHGIPGLKKTKKLWVEGYIATGQSVDVFVQLDANSPTKVGTINGNGVYVDAGQSVTIGSLQIGKYPIGGTGTAPAGFHYLFQITINTTKYKYFTIMFSPTGIGYFSVQMYANYNIITGPDKLPLKYRNLSQASVFTGSGGQVSSSGRAAAQVYVETPKGAIDGVNTIYTVKNQINVVLNFTINGEYIPSSNYTVSGTTITMNSAISAALASFPFEIVYE